MEKEVVDVIVAEEVEKCRCARRQNSINSNNVLLLVCSCRWLLRAVVMVVVAILVADAVVFLYAGFVSCPRHFLRRGWVVSGCRHVVTPLRRGVGKLFVKSSASHVVVTNGWGINVVWSSCHCARRQNSINFKNVL